jgi:flagellar protein FlaG
VFAVAIQPVRTEDAIRVSGLVAADRQTENGKKAGNQAATQQEKEISKEDVAAITENLNSFMEELSADIRFKVHDKTGTLMVQVFDPHNDKILREFPPHELLDTVAKISEYVGSLLDKRA